jgi:Na+-transporting methylmalonyl-CoA/oxaloacetate decarboxylase gamma subunit
MQMSELLEQGVELMLAGMLTVFFFLCILIISINFFALILNKKDKEITAPEQNSMEDINTNHIRIIKEIGNRI